MIDRDRQGDHRRGARISEGTLLVVSDIDAARAELLDRGVQISEVQDMAWGARHAYFNDSDGNAWQLQQPNVRA